MRGSVATSSRNVAEKTQEGDGPVAAEGRGDAPGEELGPGRVGVGVVVAGRGVEGHVRAQLDDVVDERALGEAEQVHGQREVAGEVQREGGDEHHPDDDEGGDSRLDGVPSRAAPPAQPDREDDEGARHRPGEDQRGGGADATGRPHQAADRREGRQAHGDAAQQRRRGRQRRCPRDASRLARALHRM